MGDNKANITKARLELEEMYMGIPDESVNLTFQDFAEVRQISNNTKPESISQVNKKKKEGSSSLKKIQSIDFNRALQASSPHYNNHHHNRLEHINEEVVQNHHHHHHHSYSSPNNYSHHLSHIEGSHSHGHHAHLTMGHRHQSHSQSHNHHPVSPRCHVSIGHGVESNMDYHHNDHVSSMSMTSSMYQDQRGERRRPGIPHSKICTICSTHVYIFRHRCLVCGRVYCKNCVNIGMGDMREGRKCTECLGRRFSQRYIQRAGEVGCCFSSYPSTARQAELKWAEMGPRRSGERAYNRSEIMSTSRSPIPPRSPTMAHSSSNPNSFVMSSSYSPYTPTQLHLPF